jgi:hypothetical protein
MNNHGGDRAKFFCQVLISVSVLFFCMVKIHDSDPERLALYWGGITGIVGYWLPSPSNK